MAYKRSQIEDAICQTHGAKGEARATILVRIKRLLDIDRKLPRTGRSRGQRTGGYAFFSEKAPGKGAEISFQAYEAFALDLALRFADHGIPQQDVVEVLRDLRPDLQIEHQTILARSVESFMSEKAPPRAGELAIGSSDPIFVAIARESRDTGRTARTGNRIIAQILHGSWEWGSFIKDTGKPVTTFEITLIAHHLQSNLTNTKPRNRGRG